jgi:hypothetical protein
VTGEYQVLSRKNIWLIIIFLGLTIVFLLVSCNNSSSDNREVDYKLQKQCGEDSYKFFKKTYDDSFEGFYENHYNKKLNKCFIVVNNNKIYWKSFYDVNESKLQGLFTPDGVSCFVFEKKCESQSREEWDSLVKPYMEE